MVKIAVIFSSDQGLLIKSAAADRDALARLIEA